MDIHCNFCLFPKIWIYKMLKNKLYSFQDRIIIDDRYTMYDALGTYILNTLVYLYKYWVLEVHHLLSSSRSGTTSNIFNINRIYF